MKSDADEPVSGSATRCSTPQPSTPLPPISPTSPSSQVQPSPDEAASRPPVAAPLLCITLPPRKAHRAHLRPLSSKHKLPRNGHISAGALPTKRSAPAPNAFGFCDDDAVTLIHDFKRDALDSLCLQHNDTESTVSTRAGILLNSDDDDDAAALARAQPRGSRRTTVLERCVMAAVLAKATSPVSAKPKTIAPPAPAPPALHMVWGDRDAKASEWRDRDVKMEREESKPPAVAAAPAAPPPTPNAVDSITALQPSFSINLYPGGFSIEGRPSAHVYEAAHIPLLRSIGAGKLPVGCLLDVPNTEHLQFHNGSLLAEVRDYRVPLSKQPQNAAYCAVTRRVLLQADHLNTIADVEHMRRVCGGEMCAADALRVEQDVMMRMQHPVCLDPSPNLSLVCNYSQFVRNAARGCTPRPPLSSYRYQRVPSEDEQRAVLNSCKFEQDKPDSSRRTPKKPARTSAADGPEAPESLPEAVKVGAKISASMLAPNPVASAHNCTKPAIRRLRFNRKASGGREMTAMIWVEMRRPSVYEGVVRVEEYCVTPHGVKDVQKPSCAQYQIGNALQAKDWGNIMLTLYERDGWTLVDDSHTEKAPPMSSQAYSSLPSSASDATDSNTLCDAGA